VLAQLNTDWQFQRQLIAGLYEIIAEQIAEADADRAEQLRNRVDAAYDEAMILRRPGSLPLLCGLRIGNKCEGDDDAA
jgi:hypothetical protein